jgi:hypothetical protein
MALAIASRIGDIRRFPNPRSLANFFGLTPSSRSSGEKQRLGSITKQGSQIVRFLLGQLVLQVLRKDAKMRVWYKGIKKRRGAKIARVAVMRRLTVILWHMLSKQEPYRYGGEPERSREKVDDPTQACQTPDRQKVLASYAAGQADRFSVRSRRAVRCRESISTWCGSVFRWPTCCDC